MKRNKSIQFPLWPHFSKKEIAVVTAILRSGKVNYWTGNEGHLFEREFAEFTNCKYGIALANGTVALELALYALGIGQGDEVITSSRTFIASASCIVMRGARPVLADVDPVSQNITAETIRAVLTPKTKAIIAVHLAGWPCDMDPILKLAARYDIKVIEDCAQAHGATYKGRSVGSLGHVAAFSFCQDKIMTTGGEGGMLTTDDQKTWERAWSFKDHGKGHEAINTRLNRPGSKWGHDFFGTNWRLTEIQSAIGRRQLKKLPGWVKTRRRNAAILTDFFAKIPALRVTVPPSDIGHAYYKYYVFIGPEHLKKKWTRDRVVEEINKAGVPCFFVKCGELYLEKAFRETGLAPENRFPIAKALAETGITFFVHPTLTTEHIRFVGKIVKEVMSKASR